MLLGAVNEAVRGLIWRLVVLVQAGLLDGIHFAANQFLGMAWHRLFVWTNIICIGFVFLNIV